MSKLEEVSSKQLVLIDSSEARKIHLLTFSFTLLIGAVYTTFLWFLCSTIPGVISALLLFGSQLAIGFPASRTYYDLGVSNRGNLQFIDPAKFNGNGEHHEVQVYLGEIPLIFEKIDLQIRKYDKGSLDDLNDLVWFGIFVWSSISSAAFYLGINAYPLCLFGTLILLLACFGSYLSGYWIRRNFGFEDDLNHLQYYIEKRLKDIDSHLPENGARIYVHVLERWRSIILVNFSIRIELGEKSTLEYHMGLPSNEQECIIIRAGDEMSLKTNESLMNALGIVEKGWHTSQAKTPTGSIVRVINESSHFSVNKRSSFVTSPSSIDDSSKVTASIFSSVLSHVTQRSLS